MAYANHLYKLASRVIQRLEDVRINLGGVNLKTVVPELGDGIVKLVEVRINLRHVYP